MNRHDEPIQEPSRKGDRHHFPPQTPEKGASPRRFLAFAMMAVGSVAALVFAAAPLGSSLPIQFCFGLSLVVLASGAALRRTGAKKEMLADAASGRVQQALVSLHSLDRALKQIHAEWTPHGNLAQWHRSFDETTRPYIREFLDHRQSLQDACGFGHLAELMMRFAAVERAVNRALSASADGAAEETGRCLASSVQRMGDCLAAAEAIQLEMTSP